METEIAPQGTAGASPGIGRATTLVQVSKLGYVALRTPDLDAMVDYYTDALQFALVERSSEAAYLTTGYDHHCVVIEQAPEASIRTRVGFQVTGSLDTAEKALRNAGIGTERRSDPEPGISEVLVIQEPGGTPLHLYSSMAPSAATSAFGIRPVKLGHVASFVPDLPEIQSFYEQVLGFRWSDTIGDFFVFLRCGPDHHAVNFIQSAAKHGTHHVAYEARDWSHVKEIVDHISTRGYKLEWGPGRHGAGHNIFTYHRDPDGNYTEIFTEIDMIFDEETGYFEPRPWHETCPQGPRFWEPDPSAANKWGPFNLEMNQH
jgi:catechol 2,3-dioxygenase-like lactoylglutathione lyase family enzyme